MISSEIQHLLCSAVQCICVALTWMGFDWIEWKKPLVHSASLPPSQIGLCCHLCHNLRLDFQCNTEVQYCINAILYQCNTVSVQFTDKCNTDRIQQHLFRLLSLSERTPDLEYSDGSAMALIEANLQLLVWETFLPFFFSCQYF